MNITFFWSSLLTILFLLTSFEVLSVRIPAVTILEGKTMGTFWRVSIANISKKHSEHLWEEIQKQLDSDEQLLSTWKSDSALMRFNLSHSTAPYPIDETIADIIIKSLHIGHKTHGAMDITAGKLVNLWGFGPDNQPINIPTQEEIDAARSCTGLQYLTVINQYRQQYLQKEIPDLFIDLSTVGEGYAADHLANLMAKKGITLYLVSVGGALVSRGTRSCYRPWQIAIQKPTDEINAAQDIVDINGNGISTSGSYRNYYDLKKKRISHIIDPHTGHPIESNLVSVTVIAPTALEADAWDTGLMVLGIDKTKEIACKQGLAVYMIIKCNDGFKTWISPSFHGYLVKTKN